MIALHNEEIELEMQKENLDTPLKIYSKLEEMGLIDCDH